jgi:lycopene cyclase domain-containing protein
MTYWALNAIFLDAVALVLLAEVVVSRRRRLPERLPERLNWPAIGVTAAVLLMMTAVFDNVMIGIGLVAYNESLISGAFIGIAPLEDFAYAIAAVVGLPSLWALLDRSRTHGASKSRGHAGAGGPDHHA